MKIFAKLTLLVMALILVFSPFSVVRAAPEAVALYVAPGAPAIGSCTRSVPCDFRYAVEIVASGGETIYARSGTYTALDPSSVHLLYIHKSLTIVGSCTFDAVTPVTCTPQNMDSNLDGETNKRVISIQGLGNEEVHIEGFTIMRGNADGVGAGTCEPYFAPLSGCGGGIFAEQIDTLTLKNNYIWSNTGGNSGGLGGGLYAEDVNHLIVEDNTFIFNIAASSGRGMGGGAFVVGSGGPHGVVFDNNIISGNEVSTDDDSGFGAGLMTSESNNVQILDNVFSYQNYIQHRSMAGVSIFIGDTTGFSIEGNRFYHEWGFSMLTINGLEGPVTDGSISKNKVFDTQVARNLEFIGPVTVDVFNNFLGHNYATRGGGSANIYIVGDAMLGNANVDIYFNTLAAANFGVQVNHDSDVLVMANIFTELITEAMDLYSTTDVTYAIDTNLFYNNVLNGAVGTNPIYANPMLVDIANGDFHLQPGSGAIDQIAVMDFAEDIDGGPRPIGLGLTPFDLGADEYALPLYLPFALRGN